MRETTVARTYAEALLEFAVEENDVDRYSRRLNEIADLIETQPEFRRFLETPGVQSAEKNRVLQDVFKKLVPDHFLKFLFVVIEKRRQRLLPAIADEFALLVDEHFGRMRVQVTVASELESTLQKRLKKRLDEMLGKDALPHYSIDPRIIGGAIFRIGDRVMDGSMRRRLQLLRRRLLKADASG